MGKSKIEITGLRKRWLISSLSPIFVVALLVAGTFCVGMANYYYNMMQDGLRTRASHASTYFTSNTMSSYPEFYQSAYNFAQEFSERDRMELQFIGSSGKILVSSYGLTAGMSPGTPDIYAAFQSRQIEPFRGVDPNTGEHIMSVCAPLLLDDQVVGAMRYVTSMSAVQRELLITVAIAVGLLAACTAMVYVSNMVFINNVVEPVAEVTETAKRIAGGSYGTQMENHYRDEIGQLIDAINNMSSQISKSEKIKSEFISSVSHELRTPLTAITGWAETIQNGECRSADDIRKGMGIIVSESKRLGNMVEELLEFSRMQFTPDVMPSDITGFSLYNKATGQMEYQPGAVLCNLFLADELNRATSRTQSALLEAMQEHTVTVGNDSHALTEPFLYLPHKILLKMKEPILCQKHNWIDLCLRFWFAFPPKRS